MGGGGGGGGGRKRTKKERKKGGGGEREELYYCLRAGYSSVGGASGSGPRCDKGLSSFSADSLSCTIDRMHQHQCTR